MKYRVKEIIDSDGASRFMVQSKFVFIWCDLMVFASLEEAKTYALYEYEARTIIHKVN